MFRTVRAVVIAVVIAASLLGSASIATANTKAGSSPLKSPPAQPLDITWE